MIGIIDYGLGNIHAFLNIYKRLHIEAIRIKTPSDFRGVTKIILPGVGAFDHAIDAFNKSGLRNIVEDLVFTKGVPILGVCVGLQMFADGSDEGVRKGLGWIPGWVKQFVKSYGTESLLMPHMGWTNIKYENNSKLFISLPENPDFYFLHSYYFLPKDPNVSVASS